ncbi:hypothetical protein ACGFNU_42265 [Spirillospora sp. NPDC048911]|uniref:hypothetical protein n=1 Tax=Spirillospora sp. NPDC048911 TaxID=3364527 RepID=UPI003717DD4F
MADPRPAPVTDAQRAALADELEMRGSPLCDCAGAGPPPISPLTGGAVAYHCECAAVRASALVRRAASRTRHAAECGCGLADDVAGRFWDEANLAERPGPRGPGSGAC